MIVIRRLSVERCFQFADGDCQVGSFAEPHGSRVQSLDSGVVREYARRSHCRIIHVILKVIGSYFQRDVGYSGAVNARAGLYSVCPYRELRHYRCAIERS